MDENMQGKTGSSLGRLITMVLMLGALLVGVGGLLFIYSHWATFGRLIKISLFFSTSLISLIAGRWLIVQRKQYEKTGHALCFLSALLWVLGAYWTGLLYQSFYGQEVMLLLAQIGVLISLLIDPLVPTGLLSMGLAFWWCGAQNSEAPFMLTLFCLWYAVGSIWQQLPRFKKVGVLFSASGALGALLYLWSMVEMFRGMSGLPPMADLWVFYLLLLYAAFFAVGRLVLPVLRTRQGIVETVILLAILADVVGSLWYFPQQAGFVAGVILTIISMVAVLYGIQNRRMGILVLGVVGISRLVLETFGLGFTNFQPVALLLLGIFWFIVGLCSSVTALGKFASRGFRWFGSSLIFIALLIGIMPGVTFHRSVFAFPSVPLLLIFFYVLLMIMVMRAALANWFNPFVRLLIAGVALLASMLFFAPAWVSYPLLYLALLLAAGVGMVLSSVRKEGAILPHPAAGTPVLPHPAAGTPVLPHPTAGTPVLPHPTAGTPVRPELVEGSVRTVLLYGGVAVLAAPLFSFAAYRGIDALLFPVHAVPLVLFVLGVVLVFLKYLLDRPVEKGSALSFIGMAGMTITLLLAYPFSFPQVFSELLELRMLPAVMIAYFLFCVSAAVLLAIRAFVTQKVRSVTAQIECAGLLAALVPVGYAFFYKPSWIVSGFFGLERLSAAVGGSVTLFACSLFFNFFIMGAGALFFTKGLERAKKRYLFGGLALIFLPIISQLFVQLDFDHLGGWLTLYSLALGIVISKLPLFARVSPALKESLDALHKLGLVISFVALYATTFRAFLHVYKYGIWGASAYIAYPHVLGRYVLVPLGLLLTMWGLKRARGVWELLEQVLSLLLLAFVAFPSYGAVPLFTNLCFVVASCILVGHGMEKQKLAPVGWGLSALLVLFITRFYDYFWSTLSRSLFFMACGVFLLALGAFFEWQRREIEQRGQ